MTNDTKVSAETLASQISLADQIAHIEFCAEQAKNIGYVERAMELAILQSLRSQRPALSEEQREALHGGAQALSSMAYDMERRKIDKTEGLRNYAAILRALASKT
jgi:hypothetical protein